MRINGKEIGLPKKVPRAEAIKFPLRNQARSAAIRKCRPIKGRKDVNAPAATPAATACGVAVILKILLVTY